MKPKLILLALSALCIFAGCARSVRSISQSGYANQYCTYPAPYARELDEYEVLGLDRTQSATEEEIQRAVREAKPIRLSPGSPVLLIQSGAIFPDAGMVAALSKTFRVVPFTGLANELKPAAARSHERTARNVAIIADPDKPATIVPLSTVAKERYQTAPPTDQGAYSRTLRLAAARAGAAAIVCYWGILESGSEDLPTKTVTWLPAVNWVLPDEKQHMRINLKVAVVDVATGSWSVFSVQPPESGSVTRRTKREATDQRLVESLNQKAYAEAAESLAQLFAGVAAQR